MTVVAKEEKVIPASISTPRSERLARQSLILNRSAFFAAGVALTEVVSNVMCPMSIPQAVVSTFAVNLAAGLWINNLSSNQAAMPIFYALTQVANQHP